jgi:hypothetical protein
MASGDKSLASVSRGCPSLPPGCVRARLLGRAALAIDSSVSGGGGKAAQLAASAEEM